MSHVCEIQCIAQDPEPRAFGQDPHGLVAIGVASGEAAVVAKTDSCFVRTVE